MNNFLTLPALLTPALLTPALVTPSVTPCGPLELNTDCQPTRRLGRVSRAWASAVRLVRGVARAIRYQPSLSHQAIADSGVNDLLRRH